MARIFLKVGFSTKEATLKWWPRIDFAFQESMLRRRSARWKWTPWKCDVLEVLAEGLSPSWSSWDTAWGFRCCQLWLQFLLFSKNSWVQTHTHTHTHTHTESLWNVNVSLDGLLEFGSQLERQVNSVRAGWASVGQLPWEDSVDCLGGGGCFPILCEC